MADFTVFFVFHDVAVKRTPVLHSTSLLPSQPKPVYPYIYSWDERSKLKCLAQEHNMRARTGFELKTLGS